MLLIFGLGYSGRAIAKAAAQAGIEVWATARDPDSVAEEAGVTLISFDCAEPAIRNASHILVTTPPGDPGDPVLARHARHISTAPKLRWIGYLSTTGVYGNRDGEWVDEDSAPAPQSPRAERRVQAEASWSAYAGQYAVDIFRLAGIYGPGRSMFDDLRAGIARRVVKPGHLFGRIHRDDIARRRARGNAARTRQPAAGFSIFPMTSRRASADVVVEAARLLGVDPPAPVPLRQGRNQNVARWR